MGGRGFGVLLDPRRAQLVSGARVVSIFGKALEIFEVVRRGGRVFAGGIVVPEALRVQSA
jgi:hypothetical protein